MTLQEEYYRQLYAVVRSIMGQATPLRKDCGLLCGGACCKGDENTGMLLFPFEQTSFRVKEEKGVRLAVCPGHCNRDERPLSCIIFPFFPYLSENGELTVIPDIRGYDVCPLVRGESGQRVSRSFRHRLRKVGRVLIKDENCRRFIEEISRETDKILNLMG